MGIFRKIDHQPNIIGGCLAPADYIFSLPKKPGIMFSKQAKRIKQEEYNDIKTFVQNLNAWNENGFDVLAKFLFFMIKNCPKITVRDLDPKTLSFKFMKMEELIDVKLRLKSDNDSHPIVVIKRGNIIKEYACNNMGADGLLIDLMTIKITSADAQKSVTRYFSGNGFNSEIRGVGYVTEIATTNKNNSPKLLLNEEKLLFDLLEKNGTSNVATALEILYYHASEEMASRKVAINVYQEPKENEMFRQWLLLQTLNVNRSFITDYRAVDLMGYPLAGVFSSRFSNESEDYLPHITGDLKDPKTIKFYELQKQTLEDMIEIVNQHTNNKGIKELSFTSKRLIE